MSEQKRRKGKLADKEFKVSIDTEKFDAEIVKDETGFRAEIDTPRVDVTIEKTDDKFVLDIEIDDKAEYQIVGTGKDKRMPRGTMWRVTGAILKTFLKQGIANLKKNR
jgi:Icc-related predicted phosphoesterase